MGLVTVFRMCGLLLPIVLGRGALAETLRQQEKSHPASCYIFIMPELYNSLLIGFPAAYHPLSFYAIPNC